MPLHQSNKWISRWRLRNSLSSHTNIRWRCGSRRWSHTLQARWEQSSWSLRSQLGKLGRQHSKRKERGEHWKARRRSQRSTATLT